MIKINEKDEKIIKILKEHAEYSTRQIAEKTSMPVTTVHNRIRRLKREGIIKKYKIDLDNKKLGLMLAAYILIYADLRSLKESGKNQHKLANQIRKLPFVEHVSIVSGGADLVARVRMSNIEEMDDFLLKKLQILDGISKTETMVVISEIE